MDSCKRSSNSHGGYLICINTQQETNFKLCVSRRRGICRFISDVNDPYYSEPSEGWKWVDGSSGTSNASTVITATLSAVSSKTVTVTLAASGTATGGGTDYTLSSSTITIPPGQTTERQQLQPYKMFG